METFTISLGFSSDFCGVQTIKPKRMDFLENIGTDRKMAKPKIKYNFLTINKSTTTKPTLFEKCGLCGCRFDHTTVHFKKSRPRQRLQTLPKVGFKSAQRLAGPADSADGRTTAFHFCSSMIFDYEEA
jgi:hypothetical protein